MVRVERQGEGYLVGMLDGGAEGPVAGPRVPEEVGGGGVEVTVGPVKYKYKRESNISMGASQYQYGRESICIRSISMCQSSVSQYTCVWIFRGSRPIRLETSCTTALWPLW